MQVADYRTQTGVRAVFCQTCTPRLSALRLNGGSLTLRAATKCLLNPRIHFGTRFALVTVCRQSQRDGLRAAHRCSRLVSSDGLLGNDSGSVVCAGKM